VKNGLNQGGHPSNRGRKGRRKTPKIKTGLIAGEMWKAKDGTELRIPAAAIHTDEMVVPPPISWDETRKTLQKAQKYKDKPKQLAEALKPLLSTARPKKGHNDINNVPVTPNKPLKTQDFYWQKYREDLSYVLTLREYCLSSFKTFCLMAFRYVYRKNFIWNDHHTTMYRELLDVYLGNNQNLVINIAPRYGKCLPAGNKVLTDAGYIDVSEVQKGQTLAGHSKGNLVYRKTAAVDMFEKECTTILSKSGRKIEVSSDHPVLTQRGWVEAKDLTENHYLIRLCSEIEGRTRIPDAELDFITLMLFEGGCSNPGCLRFTTADAEVIGVFKKACEALDIPVVQYQSSQTTDYNLKGGRQGKAVLLLEKYGMVGKLAKHKTLPRIFFDLPLDQKYRFISLMIATDGYVNQNHGQIAVTLASEPLIDEISLLLDMCNIPNRKYVKPNECAGAFEITIGASHVERLRGKINALQKQQKVEDAYQHKNAESFIFGYPCDVFKGLQYKALQLENPIRPKTKNQMVSDKKFKRLKEEVCPDLAKWEMSDFIYDRVKKVEPSGIKKVYHIEIDTEKYDDKNFIANGYVVHNTEFMCLFVAWTFVHNPLCEWLHLSYSDALACRNSDKIKDIIKSQWYFDLFGGQVTIDPKKDSKTEWHLKQGGVFYAVSSGGQVTGFGAGSSEEIDEDGKYVFSGGIWIDDPLKPDDAHTIRRDQINERWSEVIKSRRNSPKTTPTICIMQRIHEGDFTAELLSDVSEKFRLLKMKTLKDDGTALWSIKHSVQQLEDMRAQNAYVFSSQYQQEPSPVGGSVFKAEWWKEYIDRPAFEAVIVTVDTAQKTGQHNDFSVFQAWGLHASAIYLINQLRGKWEAPDLIKQAVLFLKDIGDTYRIRALYIEDKVSGTGLIQTLPALTNIPVIALQRNKDKAEATSFSPEMTHLHDDQVDAFMDATEILLAQNQKTTVIHDVLQSCVF
jgi:intein/homing endonuclease